MVRFSVRVRVRVRVGYRVGVSIQTRIWPKYKYLLIWPQSPINTPR